MRVIVIGAGEVGFDISRMLSREGHDVIVIDVNQEHLDNVNDRLDVMTMLGSGTSAGILQEASVGSADLLLAVTSIDEVNIIACMMADRLGVDTTVARVRSDEFTHHGSVLKPADFGIDLLIQPEVIAAEEISRLIRRAGATDVIKLAEGALQVIGMRLDDDSPVKGLTLIQLMQQYTQPEFRILGIRRGVRSILPRGKAKLKKDDQVFVLARAGDINKVAQIMGKKDKHIKDVMILGGSRVGAKLAKLLSHGQHGNIKLIEQDRERAEYLAGLLDHVLVIHGDPADVDLMATEGIGEMDSVVAVTNDEESNLVTCLMAKHLGVRKTVALLSKTSYIPISKTIGLDAAVNKKLSVSHEILRYMRGQHVLSVATLHGLNAEILEVEAGWDSPGTERPLSEVDLPAGILVGAVISERGLEIATGKTTIYAGDRIILFALPKFVAEIENWFGTAGKST